MRTRLAGAIVAAAISITTAGGAALAADVSDANVFIVHKNGTYSRSNTFREAIDDLGSAKGTLYLPAGDIQLDNDVSRSDLPISLVSGQGLVGAEGGLTVIKNHSTNEANYNGDFIHVDGDNVTISNLKLERSYSTTWSSLTGNGIDLQGNDFCTIDTVQFKFHNDGIVDTGDGSDFSDFVAILGPQMTEMKDNFIDFTRSTGGHWGIYITKGAFDMCGGNGIVIRGNNINSVPTGNTCNYIVDNLIEVCGGDGIQLIEDNHEVRGVRIGFVGSDGIEGQNVKNAKLVDNYIHHAGNSVSLPTNVGNSWPASGGSVSGHGINLSDVGSGNICESIQILGCTTAIGGGNGIRVDEAKDVIISNCITHSNGQSAANTFSGILLLNDFLDVQCIGNRAYNDTAFSGASTSQDFGIRVASSSNAADFLIVVGNNLRDASGFQSDGFSDGSDGIAALEMANNLE